MGRIGCFTDVVAAFALGTEVGATFLEKMVRDGNAPVDVVETIGLESTAKPLFGIVVVGMVVAGTKSPNPVKLAVFPVDEVVDVVVMK